MLRTIINNAIRKVTFRQQSLCKYENVTHNQQSSGMSSNNLDLEVNRIVWFDLEVRMIFLRKFDYNLLL